MKKLFICLTLCSVICAEPRAQVTDAEPPELPGGEAGTKGGQPQPYDGQVRFRVIPSRQLPSRYGTAASQTVPSTVSIDFPGGTPEVLVDFLREALGKRPNVMISPQLANAELPPFRLQNVTVEDVFQALNELAGESIGGLWQLTGSREPIWVLNPIPQLKPSEPLAIDPVTGRPLSYRTKREVRIFPIGQFMGEYTVEDVTTSIQTAWGLMGEEPAGEIKFHKDTNLLIAVGSAEQLKLLREVLGALSDDLAWKTRKQAARPADDKAAGKTP